MPKNRLFAVKINSNKGFDQIKNRINANYTLQKMSFLLFPNFLIEKLEEFDLDS